MKFLIVFAALCAIAYAAPAGEVGIVRQESDVGPESWKFAVETTDGSKHNADGVLKNAGTKEESIVVHGSFSFVGDDGKTYTVNYVADENGFQPEGAHLPVAPVA